MKKATINVNGNNFQGWTSEEISKEKKEIMEIRKIFSSKGITGDNACKVICEMRHGKSS